MKNRLSVLAALCALFVLVVASPEVISSSRTGLRLCCELILPSLFPFFVVSGYLGIIGFPEAAGLRLAPITEKLFRCSGVGSSALLIGLCGGYPMGAAYLAQLERQGELRAEEGNRLLRFCNNTGPAFLIGTIGSGVFSSSRAGLLLWLAHALAAVTAGILLRGNRPIPSQAAKSKQSAVSPGAALVRAIRDAVTASLNVCGTVVCFSVLTGLLEAGGLLDLLCGLLCRFLPLGRQAARAILIGFFELGSGVNAMKGLSLSPASLALGAALAGWGGLSVQLQSLSLLADSDMKSAPHLAGRCMSMLFGSAWAYVLGLLFL